MGGYINCCTGNYELAKVFNEVVTSDDLYKFAIKSGDHLGDDFLKIFSEIARDPKLGIEPAQHLVKVLSSLSDETLTALKVSPTSLSDSLKGLAKSSGKIAPEVMTKILDNKNLYTHGYKQSELLKDVGEIAHVKGFDILADALTIGNKNGLKEYKAAVGFRWELDAAAQLNRAGLEVGEFSKKVVNRKDGKVATDIDIILKDGTYIQTKASNSTVGGAKGTAPFGTKAKMTAWVNKARADGAKKIWYIVPKGTHITKGVRDHLTGTDKKELGIDAIVSNIILR